MYCNHAACEARPGPCSTACCESRPATKCMQMNIAQCGMHVDTMQLACLCRISAMQPPARQHQPCHAALLDAMMHYYEIKPDPLKTAMLIVQLEQKQQQRGQHCGPPTAPTTDKRLATCKHGRLRAASLATAACCCCCSWWCETSIQAATLLGSNLSSSGSRPFNRISCLQASALQSRCQHVHLRTTSHAAATHTCHPECAFTCYNCPFPHANMMWCISATCRRPAASASGLRDASQELMAL